jgi:hypothetical protein
MSVRDDLVFLLELMRDHLQDACTGPAYNVLAQLNQSNPNLAKRYHDEVIEPRRERFRVVLRRGAATGELRADIDVDRALLMLIAPVLTATRLHTPGEPIGRAFCVGLVDDLLAGIAPR